LHKLSPVSRQDLIRRLKRLGDDTIIIPNPHHGEKIGIELLSRILRDGCISREEWFSTDD